MLTAKVLSETPTPHLNYLIYILRDSGTIAAKSFNVSRSVYATAVLAISGVIPVTRPPCHSPILETRPPWRLAHRRLAHPGDLPTLETCPPWRHAHPGDLPTLETGPPWTLAHPGHSPTMETRQPQICRFQAITIATKSHITQQISYMID
jgi:hypothetical protein